MKNSKGFTLVELMVVIAIVAILAAVALPMYSTFKQKSKVGAGLQSLQGSKTALQVWYDDNGGSFSQVDTVPSVGGSVMAGTKKVGAGLSEVDGIRWGTTPPFVGAAGAVSASISFTFSWTAPSGCPSQTCFSTWRLTCFRDTDLCRVAATVGEGDALNLNLP